LVGYLQSPLIFSSPFITDPGLFIKSGTLTMGKNGRANKHASKVNDKSSISSSSKATPKKAASKPQPKKDLIIDEDDENETPQPLIPIELYQLLLSIFKDSFPTTLSNEKLQEVLQEVKGALYRRDFEAAFGKEEYLEAYAVRWSPSRALGYTEILVRLKDHLQALMMLKTEEVSELDVVCFGGGAAEVVAFGGLVKILRESNSEASQAKGDAELLEELSCLSVKDATLSQAPKINIILIDCADWQRAVQKLCGSLTTLPTLSKYANVAAREANSPLLAPGALSTTFQCKDVLEFSLDQLGTLVSQKPLLISLLFTLNELYTSSIPKTTAFLLKLTASVKSGTLLLVVDSPGSYSETTLGSGTKQYPMHWLLDHTLLESQNSKSEEGEVLKPEWKKVVSETSKWFRTPDSLKYPIPLENMRYQMHLYQRL
jgi:25S rRNA (uracil2843-N3)-methyltransferase